jgi:hypothetical protein
MAKCSKPQAAAMFFEDFQKKFKKSLKFRKSLPLSGLDTPQSAYGSREKNFKFFQKFLVWTLKFLKTVPLPV